MINWPSNPTTGQIYTNPSGASWKFNGKGWVSIRSSNVVPVPGPTGPAGNAFTYQFAHSFMNPVDDISYYIGNVADQPAQSGSSIASKRVKVLYSGSIKKVTVSTNILGDIGSTESQSFYIRNHTTATQSTIVSSYIHSTFSQIDNYTLSTPLVVNQNDEMEIIWQVPTFQYSPTNVRHLFNAFFDTL